MKTVKQRFKILVPKEMLRAIDIMVKKGKYTSRSKLMEQLIVEKIEEEKLWRSINKSEAEFKAGKGKILRFLKDLR